MIPSSWLDDLFGSVSRVRILRTLAREPARSWSQRELARAIRMSVSTTSRAIRELDAAGILHHERVGSTSVIRLRPGLRVAALLRRIFGIEREGLRELRGALARAIPRGTACYLYGSTARGTAGRGSDVDVFLVAPTRRKAHEAAVRLREAAAGVMPLPLEVIALDVATARRRRRTPLLQAILREGEAVGPTTLEDLL